MQTQQVSKADIERTFHLPHHEACILLKLTREELIQISRAYGIKRLVIMITVLIVFLDGHIAIEKEPENKWIRIRIFQCLNVQKRTHYHNPWLKIVLNFFFPVQRVEN
jgi:hypothetical protein